MHAGRAALHWDVTSGYDGLEMIRMPEARSTVVGHACVLSLLLATAACSLVVPDDAELKGGGAGGAGATGSSSAGSSQGGAGGTTGTGGSGGAVTPAYTIYTPTAPIDYNHTSCSDFFNAPTITFSGHQDPTDNTVACRLLWVPDSNVIHGCCEIADAHLQASHSPGGAGDSPEYWLDDGIEMVLSAGLEQKNTPSTIKTAVTVRGAHWDANFPDDSPDERYDGSLTVATFLGRPPGTIDDPSDVDVGYVLKWKANIGFDVSGGDVAMCNFIMNDDDPSGLAHWIAFGDYEQFNWPPSWQPCAFVDGPAP